MTQSDQEDAFDGGIDRTLEILAQRLGVTDWYAADGSEDHDQDVGDTIMNILKAKGLYDEEDGSWAALRAPAQSTPIPLHDQIALDTALGIENLPREWPRGRRVAAIQVAIEGALSAALREMEARKDAAYEERNKVVAALSKLFPSGTARTAIPGWSDDWHGCVYIDLPTGQVSWHFHDDQRHLFAGLPVYTKPWDGHDTEEKYRRLAALGTVPPQERTGWHPIETAPRDGTHILAYRALIGIRYTNLTNPPAVVHWFDDPDEPGFYTSVNERAPEHPFNPTHWKPLEPPPTP